MTMDPFHGTGTGSTGGSSGIVASAIGNWQLAIGNGKGVTQQ